MTNPINTMLNENSLQPSMQPYVRLTQRNMQLLTRFSASPEMVSLWLKNGQKIFAQTVQEAASGKTSHEPKKMVKQVQENISDVGQSKAFASLLQGLMQSHLEFLTDLAQTNMAALSQMSNKMIGNLQQASLGEPPAEAPLEEQPATRAKRKAH
ncbi:hypothetical protein [Azohydromonas lata]|uniref:Phasin domain-containing protein n=1 Tax=Azohydromonas lata TaxID=45677 RepID=A0ABU5ICJ2_9BURK|nr:hypothetical protein [Azohydromonas lata]MDZ5456827.1 hypothetical protein [Azohydromonas lata]